MSNPVPLSPIKAPVAHGRTHAAIADAARATGTDFSYLLAQAKIESGLDPMARARTSSASGLFQFIDSTWLATLDRHGAAHGLGHLSQAIDTQGGRPNVRDPALRQQIMALRHNPAVASVMAGALAQDNRAALLAATGREPDAAELYLAHFLGAGGATTFLRALTATPDRSAASLMPAAAAANRAIFYADGAPRSLSQVMDLIRGKVGRAMNDTAVPASASAARPHAPLARFNAVDTASNASGEARRGEAARPSMSRLLENSFGLAAGRPGDAAPAHVRAAYAKLRALSL